MTGTPARTQSWRQDLRQLIRHFFGRRNRVLIVVSVISALVGFSLPYVFGWIGVIYEEAQAIRQLRAEQRQTFAAKADQLYRLAKERAERGALLDSALRGSLGPVENPDVAALIHTRKEEYDAAYLRWNVEAPIVIAELESYLTSQRTWGPVARVFHQQLMPRYLRHQDKCLDAKFSSIAAGEPMPSGSCRYIEWNGDWMNGAAISRTPLPYKQFDDCLTQVHLSLASIRTPSIESTFWIFVDRLWGDVTNQLTAGSLTKTEQLQKKISDKCPD